MVGFIRQLSVNLFRNALLTIYKSFLRPHLHYADILYDKPNNKNFQNKMEKVRYRACLAITGGIQGTSRGQLYDESSLHSLVKELWRNKLVFFIKTCTNRLPLLLSRFLFARKLSIKIIINLCYKTSSNKSKTLQKNVFSILCKRME